MDEIPTTETGSGQDLPLHPADGISQTAGKTSTLVRLDIMCQPLERLVQILSGVWLLNSFSEPIRRHEHNSILSDPFSSFHLQATGITLMGSTAIRARTGTTGLLRRPLTTPTPRTSTRAVALSRISVIAGSASRCVASRTRKSEHGNTNNFRAFASGSSLKLCLSCLFVSFQSTW